MRILRFLAAFIASAATTYVLASIFYTQRTLSVQAEAIGRNLYTPAQQFETYIDNLVGLAPSYGLILTIALMIGFLVAAAVKRVLVPLAPVAYPVAGGAAVFTAIWLIENLVAGGGVGAIGGARDALGMSLQVLAGVLGGAVFALARPK